MKNPRSFSIIVPTYQRRDIVSETLRAICRLAYDGKVEVIVVIDGSTDGTAAALAAIDCPFQVSLIEQGNRGLAGARNRGAAAAKEEILLFLDDDMICRQDLLDQHAMGHSNGADVVIGNFVESGSSIARLDLPPGQAKRFRRNRRISSAFDMFGGNISVSRAAFDRVGGYDESFTRDGAYGGEDIDFGHRLLKHFTVNFAEDAVCDHLKRLSPREYISRAARSADSEARLLRKHPELHGALFEWSGAASVSTRLRLLSRLPLVSRIVTEVAVAATEIGTRMPFASARKLQHACDAAYALSYWSAMRRNGIFPELWAAREAC